MLKDAQGKTIKVPSAEIDRLVPQPRSLMPELLLRDPDGAAGGRFAGVPGVVAVNCGRNGSPDESSGTEFGDHFDRAHGRPAELIEVIAAPAAGRLEARRVDRVASQNEESTREPSDPNPYPSFRCFDPGAYSYS